MKELSVEQKARRYDEVLEKAKSWHVDSQIDFRKSLENLLPELAESKDERIRKELIKGISKTRPNTLFLDTNVTREEALDWLEKQSELVENNMLLPFKEYDNLMDSINKKKKEGYEAGYKQGLIDSKSEHKIELKFGV